MSIEGTNEAVLAGTLSSDPRERELESGSVLLRLEITTPATNGDRADTVPVAWFDPPATAPQLQAGDAVVVVGTVRRRYWGGAGGARSATEVVARTVVPAGRKVAVRKALSGSAAAIARACP